MMKIACLVLALAFLAHALGKMRFSNDDNDTLSQYIRQVLNNLKAEMHRGIPQLNIPPLEPLVIPAFDANIKEGIAQVSLSMRNLNIAQLSTFQVRKCKGEMDRMAIEMELFFPEVGGSGHYNLDGKILIFPLYGSGRGAVQANDLVIRLKAGMMLVDMTKIQLTNLEVDAEFSKAQIYLEGIVGGGNLGDVVNTLLNAMGKVLFDQFKGQILAEINRIALSALNNELSKVDLKDILGGVMPLQSRFTTSPMDDSANNYIDKVMENLRPHILENNLDPLPIPDQIVEFSHKILLITVRGSARLHKGLLGGLSTIHRAGNFNLKVEGSVITIEGTVGVNSMAGSIAAHAEFMGIGVGASAKIRVVGGAQVRIKISQNILQGSPQLHDFAITRVGAIDVAIEGLGQLGFLLSGIASLVVNIIKKVIINAIETPIRREIEKVLAGIKIEL